MSNLTLTEETLAAVKEAQSQPVKNELLRKSWTEATGLVNFDLQRPAKLLYPVITPLRNRIPRVKGNGGTSTNWKTITGININQVYAGVSEGNRGGIIATQVNPALALYAGLGLEDNVTFEADYAAEGFDDVKARAVEGLLRSLMIQEEQTIIGGNTSLPLGTTPTPTLVAFETGGSLTNGTYSVICVALTNDGFIRASVVGGIPTTITRTNADGSQDTFGGGSARKSLPNDAAIITGPGSIAASVAPVVGAVAYAWFWGPGGNEVLGAITTINSYLIVATATGTQLASTLPSTDNSTNALVFDGLLTQLENPLSNAYYAALPTGTAGTGTPLTSNNAGGIVQIDTALRAFWDNFRVSPDLMIVNAQELNNITNKVIAGGSAPLFRFNLDGKGNVNQLTITAGTIIGNYLNKFTMSGGTLVQVMLHPNVPPGTIIFYTEQIPYPLSNVRSPIEMKLRRDYYQIEWPLRTRKYEYGVYTDEVLAVYFPPAFGVITNIANG